MNCGTRWSLVDVIPDYAKYSKIIANINKANDIIENETKAASANEAKIIFKTTQMECNRINDHVAADLNRICDEGIKRTDQFSTYIKGKNNYDHKSFRSAIHDLSKVPGYRDADEIIEKCKIEIEAERRRQLPWSVVFSLIIPAAVGLMDDQLGTDRKVFFLMLVSQYVITAFVLDYTNSFNHFLIFPFYLFFFVICSVKDAKRINSTIGPIIAMMTARTLGTCNAYARIE